MSLLKAFSSIKHVQIFAVRLKVTLIEIEDGFINLCKGAIEMMNK